MVDFKIVVKNKTIKELTKKDLDEFFVRFEAELDQKKTVASYIILGGAALVLLEFIQRSTEDLDIAKSIGDRELIVKAAEKFGIEIDWVTQCTTVDFDECPKELVYSGTWLKVSSIGPRDLLKSKLERFEKQDPQDINAILDKLPLGYEEFKKIFSEMLQDFVGNQDQLKMKARTVVERKFQDNAKDFYRNFKLSYER